MSKNEAPLGTVKDRAICYGIFSSIEQALASDVGKTKSHFFPEKTVAEAVWETPVVSKEFSNAKGRCTKPSRNCPKGKIALDHRLFDRDLQLTFLHEVAHAIDFHFSGRADHGEQWIFTMALLGIKDSLLRETF